MKIVAVSNFDLDTVDDVLIAENVSKEYADGILGYLNKNFCSAHAKYCFFLKEDAYVLHKFEA